MQDEELMGILGDVIYSQLDDEGTGYFQLGRSQIEEALKGAREVETKQILKRLLGSMKDDEDVLSFMAW
jgi:hypothetical protein